MNRTHAPRARTRRAGGLAVATLVATFAIAGSALAGHLASGVKSYTGCLTTQGGTLTLIREGDAPARPCPGGSVEAHFSGGDITSVTAGTGLSGSGTNGDVTISLDPKYALRQDCATGQVVKWSGSAWACANDNDTTYTAGIGLQLDGTEMSLDPDYRLPQGCSLGESATFTIDALHAFGFWGCQQKANADQNCASGKFANGVDASGDIKCATTTSGGAAPLAYTAAPAGDVRMIDGGSTEVVRMDLPKGRFFVSVTGTVEGADLDDDSSGYCFLQGPGGDGDSTKFHGINTVDSDPGVIALQSLFTLTAAASVDVTCLVFSTGDQADAQSFEIIAITVG